MHSTTNYLIVNLAIADILFVFLCAPYTALEYATIVWPFGDVICKISHYMVYVTLHASVYTLVLMALDRFIAVVYPVSGMSFRTDHNTFLAIIFLWTSSFFALIPVIFRFAENFYNHGGLDKSTCMLVGSHSNNILFAVSYIYVYTFDVFRLLFVVHYFLVIICHSFDLHSFSLWRNAFATMEKCSWTEERGWN